MPTDTAGFVRFNVALLVGSEQFQQRERCLLRVSNKRKPAKVRDVRRWNTYESAKLFNAFTGGINVIDTDISEPVWLHASPHCFLRKLHKAGYRRISNAEQGIRHAGPGHVARIPAYDVRIKG